MLTRFLKGKSMLSRVLLVRHAQTDRPDVFHGFESDAGLSPLGFRQAATIAPIIAAMKPDGLHVSIMRRTRLTAEPIATACNLTPQIEPQLHERKVGILAGTPAKGEFGIWPETLREWMAGNTQAASEGAESYDAIQQRVVPVFERIVERFQGRTVVIVAHGIVIRVLLLSVLHGYAVADWGQLGHVENVSLSELQGSPGKWQAVRIGEVPAEVRALAHP